MKKIRSLVLHPFLFTLYPLLALFVHNIEEITFFDVLRSLLFSLLGIAVVFWLFKILFKDWQKAGLAASLTSLLFFSYGHVYDALKTGSLALARHRVLAPIWLGLLLLGLWWILRNRKDLLSLTGWLNTVGVILLAFPAIGGYLFLDNTLSTPSLAQGAPPGEQVSGETLPDIYYIILDGYSRDDVLQGFFNYDNTPFLDELRQLGFTVAECSRSNYAQTKLSLASSLNFRYIPSISDEYSNDTTSRAGLGNAIRHSALRSFLEANGYKTVAFETGYYWTQMTDADFYLRREKYSLGVSTFLGGLNSYEEMLLQTSGGLVLTDSSLLLARLNQSDINFSNREEHRLRVLYTLDELGKVPVLPGPKFVFAHVVSPHEPFVFNRNGDMPDDSVNEITAYRDQVSYVNGRVLTIVRKILNNSQTPPIIVLQGDHGGITTVPEERMLILNAYYLPEGGDQLLYPSISPVNTFRIILNKYFRQRYELLDDISYFSGYNTPFQYQVLPEIRPGCENTG